MYLVMLCYVMLCYVMLCYVISKSIHMEIIILLFNPIFFIYIYVHI